MFPGGPSGGVLAWPCPTDGGLDVARLFGVVSSDPNNSGCFGAMATPTNVNDGNDATAGTVGAAVCGAGTLRGCLVTLSSCFLITAIRKLTSDNVDTTADAFFWKLNAGDPWSGGGMGTAIPGSWSGGGTDAVFTPASPIPLLLARYDRVHGGGFGAQLNLFTLELRA